MPRQELVSAKIPSEWLEVLTEKARSTGSTKSDVIKTAIAAYLGIEARGVRVDPVDPVDPVDRTDLERRVSTVENGLGTVLQELTRLTALIEQAPKPVDPVDPVDRPKPEATPRQKPLPTTEGQNKRADGKRWLTTKQAWEVAQSRESDRSFNAFRSWSKREPEECLRLFGLRYLAHGKKSNVLASFEDVQFSD